jgi:hypothetical protein
MDCLKKSSRSLLLWRMNEMVEDVNLFQIGVLAALI